MSNFLRSHGLQHTRPPCPSTPRACSNSCPLYMCIYIFIHIYMYGDSIQPSHPQSSLLILLQSFPASGSFLMSQFFASGSQSYWNFSFSFSLSNEHPGPISFRMDWLDLLAVQGILKSLLQHHNSKASILQRSACMVQLSHLYMTTRKTTALTIWTFVSKAISSFFNTLSRFVIAFLSRSKHL